MQPYHYVGSTTLQLVIGRSCALGWGVAMSGIASVSRCWLLAAALILSGVCGATAQAQAPDDECKDGAVLPVRSKGDLRSVR